VEPQEGGDVVVLREHQPVRRAAGGAVERVPHVQQVGPGVVERTVRAVREPGGHQGVDDDGSSRTHRGPLQVRPIR
jgi:hypothetical protein